MLEAWGFGPYDLDEIVNEYVRRANGRCNTEVIRSFVYNSGEMMDNLASLIPDTSDVFDYEGGQCIVQIAYDKPSGADYPVEVSGYKMWASTVQTVGTKNEQPVGKKQKTGISRLAEIEEYCRDAAEDLGAEWFCGQTAARCVQDADGAVKGIIAEDADGNYVKFEAAKGVILATGDFGGNTDMVWELCSECAENAERHGVDRAELMGMTDCDGSGHKIGCWAGGAIESHPRPVAGDAPSISFGPWGSTPCLWMNCNGQRFMNESFAGLVLAQSCRQPINLEAKMVGNFAIMDSKYMSYIQVGGLDHGAPNWGFPEASRSSRRRWRRRIRCRHGGSARFGDREPHEPVRERDIRGSHARRRAEERRSRRQGARERQDQRRALQRAVRRGQGHRLRQAREPADPHRRRSVLHCHAGYEQVVRPWPEHSGGSVRERRLPGADRFEERGD